LIARADGVVEIERSTIETVDGQENASLQPLPANRLPAIIDGKSAPEASQVDKILYPSWVEGLQQVTTLDLQATEFLEHCTTGRIAFSNWLHG
jgi:hypothetical protein